MPRIPHRLMRFDCVAGISGDMIVAALVDMLSSMGMETREILETPPAIVCACEHVTRLSVDIKRVLKSGFPASQLHVDIEEDHHHVHAGDMKARLTTCAGNLGFKSREANNFATRVFDILLDAENKAHGIDGSMQPHAGVHLHELASADTLLDILCATKALEMLGFFDPDAKPSVVSTPVAVGRGSIKIAHGIVPVPAPGTLEIMKRFQIPYMDGPVDGELATPTGIALLAAMEPSFLPTSRPAKIIAVGTGAGTKDFPGLANILRVQLLEIGESGSSTQIAGSMIDGIISRSTLELLRDEVIQVSMFIDDANPEDVGYLIRQSYDLGAKEVFNIPVQGKK
nr:LarC family nickel insertion protein [Candidatus Sigynarchaeota archaeon]